jgi:peptidoglycan/LPS O-acetylase OafA/YrhL
MRHIWGFDAIRAASVLLVIASHAGVVEASQNPVAVQFFSVFNANLGVKAFFVLSGFLITTLLLHRLTKTGGVDIPDFMLRRAFRILPLYFVTLLSLFPFVYFGRWRESAETAAYGLFFAYNFIPNELNVHYLSHLWSLGVEEQFYIIWPFLFAAFALRKRALIAICAGVIALCWLVMVTGFGDSITTHTPSRWTIPAVYPIALGAALAIAIETASLQTWFRNALSTKSCLIVASALILLPLAKITPMTLITQTIGVALGICWIYLNQHNKVVQRLDWGPIGYLGMISYGLYMYQGLLTGNGPYRTISYWPPAPWIGAALTFPVAMLSYHYFERPIMCLRSTCGSKNKKQL